MRRLFNNILYPGHNIERGRVAVFIDRHQRAAIPILPHDVCLRRKSVANVRHIPHIQRRTVRGLHRQIVQLRYRLRRSVHLHVVFQRTQLDRPAGQDDVLCVHRIHNVTRLQPVRLQLWQIQVHLNLPNLPAIGIRRRRSRHRCQVGAQKILTQVEQLLLRQSLAAQSQLNNRRRRRAIRDDQRWRGPWRQTPDRGLRDRGDLCDGALYVRPRPEENLDHAQPVHRLRFHVLDIVDRGGDAAFGIRHDPVGHVLRRQPCIEPHHRDHRNVDTREYIGGRPQNRDRRQNKDDQRHHHKRVRTSKS